MSIFLRNVLLEDGIAQALRGLRLESDFNSLCQGDGISSKISNIRSSRPDLPKSRHPAGGGYQVIPSVIY